MTIAAADADINFNLYRQIKRDVPASPCTLFTMHKIDTCIDEISDENQTPQKRNCYEMIWVRTGEGNLCIDLEQFEIKSNTLYVIAPGQLHLFRIKKDLTGYCISFANNFISGKHLSLLRQGIQFGINSCFRNIEACPVLAGEIEELLEVMIQEYAAGLQHAFTVVKELLTILIIYLSRNFGAKERSEIMTVQRKIVQKFMQLLQENVRKKKQVEDYANELAVTPDYLSHLMKLSSGYTARQLIQQYIVLEAKRQALYFGNNLKQAAYDLGFDDPAHFSKFFKKNAGRTFRAFKNDLTRRQLPISIGKVA